MNFGREKFYQGISWNLLVMVLGCPCNQEINFSKIRVAQNSVTQRIPRKCWIDITKITVASSGSRPCFRYLNKLAQSTHFFGGSSPTSN